MTSYFLSYPNLLHTPVVIAIRLEKTEKYINKILPSQLFTDFTAKIFEHQQLDKIPGYHRWFLQWPALIHER